MTKRIEKLRTAIEANACDAYVSVCPANNQYLSGFTGTTASLVVTSDRAVFLNDFRYTEQVSQEVTGFETYEVKGDIVQRTGERLSEMGVKAAAFEPAYFTVDELNRLQKAYSGDLNQIENVVANLRRTKYSAEVDAIRSASQLAEGAMLDLVAGLREGVSERELAAQFEYQFKIRGASGVSFDPIVLFGPRSSLPHGQPGDTRLKNGDIVLLDFGCRKSGYCSDLTRTFAFGTMPEDWFQEIYELTLRAQTSALEALKPGVGCREVDAIARNIISEGGFGDYFGHGLGHGVGIEIHEGPRLNTESEAVLEAGMVVTVEPGIYLPGRGGVRIEDLVVITDDGCEVFTTSSKALEVVGA